VPGRLGLGQDHAGDLGDLLGEDMWHCRAGLVTGQHPQPGQVRCALRVMSSHVAGRHGGVP